MKILITMANLSPKVGKPSIKSGEVARGEVTGVMSMVSPKARASLAISFTTPVICDIVKRMLGEDITEITDSARDLTGEMANMMVGGAKNVFSTQGYDFAMSTPSVLSGKGHVISHQFKGRTIILPFQAPSGEFFVEICFEE
ncbi:MAG: chemotaxis protein CheX [Gammaproteobacteria bacterium]|nr:chemotaxis protein CheX [Gammaproteobacteria bacterium]